jgi:hypothetical protein
LFHSRECSWIRRPWINIPASIPVR